MSNSQQLTDAHKSLILQSLRDSGGAVKKSDLANAAGGKANSWVTKLLAPIHKGGLKTISDEDANAIEGVLGISLLQSSGSSVQEDSSLYSTATLDPDVLTIIEAAKSLYRRTNRNQQPFQLPYIPTEDLVAFGEEIVRAAHEDPEKPGKVGRIGIVLMSEIISRLNCSESISESDTSPKLPCVGSLAAGSALYNEPFKLGDEPKAWVPVNKRYPADHFAVQVIGDSMEPDIPDASTIIMKKVAPDELKTGKIYSVVDGDGGVLKKLIKKQGEWFLHSTNPKYKEYQPLEDAIIQAEFVEVIPN